MIISRRILFKNMWWHWRKKKTIFVIVQFLRMRMQTALWKGMYVYKNRTGFMKFRTLSSATVRLINRHVSRVYYLLKLEFFFTILSVRMKWTALHKLKGMK